jgi:hypothetical protein
MRHGTQRQRTLQMSLAPASGLSLSREHGSNSVTLRLRLPLVSPCVSQASWPISGPTACRREEMHGSSLHSVVELWPPFISCLVPDCHPTSPSGYQRLVARSCSCPWDTPTRAHSSIYPPMFRHMSHRRESCLRESAVRLLPRAPVHLRRRPIRLAD